TNQITTYFLLYQVLSAGFSAQAAEAIVEIGRRLGQGAFRGFKYRTQVPFRLAIYGAIQVAAQQARSRAMPIGGQEFLGQLRVAQQQTADLVDQQGAHQKALFRVQRVAVLDRPPNAPEAGQKTLVLFAEQLQVPAFAHQPVQWAGCGQALVAGMHDDDLALYVEILDDGHERVARRRRMGQHSGRKRAEADVAQLLAQLLAFVGGHAGNDGQCPTPIPGESRRRVNALVGTFETAPAAAREAVIAAPADALRRQPAFLGQPVHGSPHQALVQAQRLQRADQAAQPDGAAAWGNGVAIHGDDQ